MKAPLTIRVEVSDLALWQKHAAERNLSMSEWIRRQCNAGGEEDQWRPDPAMVARVDAEMAKRDAEDRPTENSSRAAGLPVAERSARVAARTSRAPERAAKETGIKLCRHNLSDCTICGVSA